LNDEGKTLLQNGMRGEGHGGWSSKFDRVQDIFIMPTYLYWGTDDYRLALAVQSLQDQVLDPAWLSFNFDKVRLGTGSEATTQLIQGLNQAMTPPFGVGHRLIWLVNPPLGLQTASDVVTELERTLPALPETSHLLLTLDAKPDGRSKVVKLLQKYAIVTEFSPIPPWKTEQLLQVTQDAAAQVNVQLTPAAIEQLTEAVGNDTRQLYGELEKLKLYATAAQKTSSPQPIGSDLVLQLVSATTHNSLQLATAIRQGQSGQALTLVSELLTLNEPSLKILATLIRQFRTWLWVKLLVEEGERDDRVIAQAAEVGNPKRIYFLKQEVQPLNSIQLRQALTGLLDLEVSLKQGGDPRSTLQTKVIELCQICMTKTEAPRSNPGTKKNTLIM
jgi:DNA polymerase-3 subunit delta